MDRAQSSNLDLVQCVISLNRIYQLLHPLANERLGIFRCVLAYEDKFCDELTRILIKTPI